MWVELDSSGRKIELYCRILGDGDVPLIHLHGGWGYSVYPFDRQVEALGSDFKVLIPDRFGYGRSGRRLEAFALDFHRREADETFALMDALGVESAVLWGHSDGACIAAWMGLEAPARCAAIVLEALHFDRAKPRSREFFETMATDPRALGLGLSRTLAREHGEDYWEQLLRLEGAAWRLIQTAPHSHPDLFDGRLGELSPPVLILHGTDDPRTEPGEIETVRAALPAADVHLIEGAGHCPHSEPTAWLEATKAVLDFLASVNQLPQ